MKLAWLVWDGDEWQITFEEPPNWKDIIPIAYVELKPGTPKDS